MGIQAWSWKRVTGKIRSCQSKKLPWGPLVFIGWCATTIVGSGVASAAVSSATTFCSALSMSLSPSHGLAGSDLVPSGWIHHCVSSTISRSVGATLSGSGTIAGPGFPSLG